MQNRLTIIYCGLLLTLTAFSIDILLPAFGLIASDLNTSISNVQLIVPFFIGATGVGQLFSGSLSDRFGRRIILKIGLAIYLVGGVFVFFATNIETVLAGRIFQGLGASTCTVAARAIMRDLFSGKELARNLAFATAVFAFGPIVAPLAGAGLLEFFGWRTLLLLMLVFGGLLLAYCIYLLPETNLDTDPNATRLSTVGRNIGRIFANPQSRFYLILSGIIMSMIMMILINIPAIYQNEFGISGTVFAIMFATQGTGIIIGQLINRNLITRIGIEKTTLIGSGALVFFCLAIVVFQLAGLMDAWLLTVLLTGHSTGYLVVYANAAALTLDPHGNIAGFTSSFYGFFSQVVSSIIAALLAIFIHGDLLIWSYLLLVFAVITFISLFWRQTRQVTQH